MSVVFNEKCDDPVFPTDIPKAIVTPPAEKNERKIKMYRYVIWKSKICFGCNIAITVRNHQTVFATTYCAFSWLFQALERLFFFLYNPNRPIQKSYSYYGAQEIFSDAQEILTDFQEILSDAQEILKWFFRDFLWGLSDF